MPKITSSVVIARALGLEPDGVPARTPGQCAYCGIDIREGDLSAPLLLGPSFMDDLSLAARGSDTICGHCAPLVLVEGLRASGFGAFGANGAFPFRKWADIAAALLSPPEPPFVMVYATANNQHMAWRAPVNFSRDAYRVRVGLRDLMIRRACLERAAEACQLLGTLGGYVVSATKKTLPNPFITLSPDLKTIEHGRLKKMDRQTLETGGQAARDALDLVQSLTLGETWALRFILTRNAGQHTNIATE